MKKTAIFFRIEYETKKKLQDIAKKERRSVASLIHLLIDKKLELRKENQGGQSS